MTGFRLCKWCGGRGCIACEAEEEKYRLATAQPLFTASLDSAEDMQLLRDAIGIEAIHEAYGPDGGRGAELHQNLIMASLRQALANRSKAEPAES